MGTIKFLFFSLLLLFYLTTISYSRVLHCSLLIPIDTNSIFDLWFVQDHVFTINFNKMNINTYLLLSLIIIIITTIIALMLVTFSSNPFLARKYIYFNCKKNFFEWISTDRVDIFSWITSTNAPQKLELTLSKTYIFSCNWWVT